MKTRTGVGLATTALTVIALFVVAPETANADTPPQNALEAVTKATPDTVTDAANLPTTASGTHAITGTVEGTKIDVPVKPSGKITLGAGSEIISIAVPFGSRAANARFEKPGIVSYDNKNGSTTVPVVEADGTLRLNTVIATATAPRRYSYHLTVPTGESLKLTATGAVVVGDDAGHVTAVIAAPWAKDANGAPVPTRFEVQGSTLIQIVDFTAKTAFPVVADPSVSWLWWGRTVKYTTTETKKIADFASQAQMFSYLCILGGLAGAACTTVANLGFQIVKNAATNALRAKRCLQINIPYIGPGLLYDVKC